MEHETMKLKDQEECYNRELREWKAQLKPRKQVSKYTFLILRNFGLVYFFNHLDFF